MTGFLIALLIIFFILLITSISSSKSSILQEIKTLSKKVDGLTAELEKLQRIKEAQKSTDTGPVTKLERESQIKPMPVPEPAKPAEKLPPVPDVKQTQPVPPPLSQKAPAPQRPPVLPKSEPARKQKVINYEKFIGENLINKIGIGILVLGIGIFVKYAIDQDWVGPYGRVMIGILCGGILLAVAHYLRQTYKAFSSVLLGGGIATLYFTIYIAFHFYQIFGQTAAFSLMVVITGFTVAFSLLYNRLEIAILGILGGFASPFMVSTGEGNHIVLFSYLMILNVGMLVLSYFKKWTSVNILCYVFTVIIYGSWLFTRGLDSEQPHYASGFTFATLFFLTFFIMNLINNVKEARKFSSLDFSLILSNAALYYAAGFVIIDNATEGLFTGLFTACLGAFFFTFSWLLFRSGRADKNLLYLLIGLVLTFLSLTAPVQLSGNHITLFWSAEAVLLLWLYQKSRIKLIRTGSLLVLNLMLISLAMDWFNIYLDGSPEPLPALLNKGFITGSFAFISVFVYHYLVKKEEVKAGIKLLPDVDLRPFLKGALYPVSYLTIFLEFHHQIQTELGFDSVLLALHAYTGVYLLIVYLLEKLKKGQLNPIAFPTASFIYCIWYLGMHYSIISLRNDFLANSSTDSLFLLHYLNAGILITLITLNYQILRTQLKIWKIPSAYYILPSLVLLLFILSSELDHLAVLSFHTPGKESSGIVQASHKVGYPILWGLFAFTIMFIGMKRRKKDLRIAALALIFVILIKLAVYDIRDISEGGKIAAFICLGVLLLVVSFLYQKLKVLLLEDTEKEI